MRNGPCGHAPQEMTLDCFIFRCSLQSRVISVLSYYLTSLVNLSFCRFFASFVLSKFILYDISHFCPISGMLLCVRIFPLVERKLLWLFFILRALGLPVHWYHLLCLYSSMEFSFLQSAIVYKELTVFLCKIQISSPQRQNVLT